MDSSTPPDSAASAPARERLGRLRPTAALPTRIRLRRFAGPADHARRLDVPIRIAHLTDLHVGAVTPLKVQREAVELTNAQRPDLVLLTGDFVCHGQGYLDALEEIVSGFRAPVFAVLGNHDYWSGAAEVRWALRRAGAEVLSNANTVVPIGHERIQLVGLDDAYTGHADREAAIKGLRPDLPAVGLSHIAEEADGLWAAGVPLVLAGHTHGGQITLARLHEIALGHVAGHRYVHGIYGSRSGGGNGSAPGAVYVGAGIGASVMPVRLGHRGQREVALFELGIPPGAFPEPLEEQEPLPGRPPTERKQAKRVAKVARKEFKRERRARRRRGRKRRW
ncbi:MAG: metallophosphoesterase [Deltaproteobacteria bacterium]|nr:MAG: metallophosphoesterase [Deltaproteobacteria bacterium]